MIVGGCDNVKFIAYGRSLHSLSVGFIVGRLPFQPAPARGSFLRVYENDVIACFQERVGAVNTDIDRGIVDIRRVSDMQHGSAGRQGDRYVEIQELEVLQAGHGQPG